MAHASPAPVKQEIGAPVESFSLAAIQGEKTSLDAYLEGKRGAVVVFWSGVCSHCVRYDGYLNGFAARRPEIGLVAVASRQGETPEQIRGTIAERKLAFPILHDPEARVAEKWFTQQTPRVFLIGSDRKLLYRGAIDNFKFPDDQAYQAYLEPAIGQFLAGEPLTRAETASFGCAIRSVYYLIPATIAKR